jgi:ABC-type ATPase involved in cell division
MVATHDRSLLARYGKRVLALDAGLLEETASSRPARA